MKVRNLFLVAAIVAATLAVAVTPANAIPPGSTIAAVVTGRVNASAGTCANGGGRAQFADVAITGLFTNGNQRYLGTVGVDTVNVCLFPIVAGNQLLATGGLEALTAPQFHEANAILGSQVDGTLTSLDFINLGVVAVATVGTSYSVNGSTLDNLTAHAVVVVAPAQTVACEAGIAALCGNPNVRDIVAAAIVG